MGLDLQLPTPEVSRELFALMKLQSSPLSKSWPNACFRYLVADHRSAGCWPRHVGLTWLCAGLRLLMAGQHAWHLWSQASCFPSVSAMQTSASEGSWPESVNSSFWLPAGTLMA